jgi:hypothetical protein
LPRSATVGVQGLTLACPVGPFGHIAGMPAGKAPQWCLDLPR